MGEEPKLSRPIIGPPEQYKGRSERVDAMLLAIAAVVIAGVVILAAVLFLTHNYSVGE